MAHTVSPFLLGHHLLPSCGAGGRLDFFASGGFQLKVYNITEIQDDPLDLKYPIFYENRRHLIDERLKLIRSSPEMIENIALEHFGRVRVNRAANSAIGWHPFEDRDQLIVRIT